MISLRRAYGHRLTRNAAALAVVQLVNYIAPFVMLAQLTRVLGVRTYGVVAFSVGMMQVAVSVLDLGFSLSATQKISVFRDKREYVSRLAGAVYCIKLVAFLIGACAIASYALLTEKYADHSVVFLLALLPLLGHTLQPLWFFSGIERMRDMTVFIVMGKVLSVVLVLLLVTKESDYLWVPIADGAAQLSAAAIAIVLVYRSGYRLAVPRRRDVRYALKMTWGFFASRLSVTAYTGSGVVLLGILSTPTSVAVYALAEQLYRAIQSLFAPIAQSLYPYMAKEKDLVLLRKVAIGCFGVAVVGAIMGHFVAPFLIARLFGQAWTSVLPVLDVFLIAIAIHVLTVLAGYPLAAAVNRVHVANRSVVYGALLFVVLATGIAVSTGATPTAFAWLLIISESYVLMHRVVALWPTARRQLSQSRMTART